MTKKEQRKREQEQVNKLVENAIHDFNEYMFSVSSYDSVKRLRSCSAQVFTTDRYYVLQSYNTIIAIIDRRTDCLYDFLRYVYGYTSTSAQHIAKFNHDYGGYRYGAEFAYTWYPC